jgi:hypothetical protein
MRIPAQNVSLATRAALMLADEKAFESMAIDPGRCGSVNGSSLK